jgi:hypothetical protein
MQNNRTVTYLLGAVAVLLVVIVALVVLRGQPSTGPGTAGTGSTDTSIPANMGGTLPADIPFDPATATKVPAGETPKQYVENYYKAVLAKDYAKAYALLPADKKAATDEKAFGAQLDGYGLTGYKMGEVTTTGDTTTVGASMSAPGGEFEYLWTFVKVGDGYVVKSRTLPGMGGQ